MLTLNNDVEALIRRFKSKNQIKRDTSYPYVAKSIFRRWNCSLILHKEPGCEKIRASNCYQLDYLRNLNIVFLLKLTAKNRFPKIQARLSNIKGTTNLVAHSCTSVGIRDMFTNKKSKFHLEIHFSYFHKKVDRHLC